MRTIIAGSRTAKYTDVLAALAACSFTEEISEVVCGMARGSDFHSRVWAGLHRIPIKEFPADRGKQGRAAGPIRNRQMADHADALIAVWDGQSPGTRHMIEEAKRKGLQVYVYQFEATNDP